MTKLVKYSKKGLSFLAHQGVVMPRWLLAVAGQRGAFGVSAIIGLFVVGMMSFVLYIVVSDFWPTAQAANTAIQANTATDTGTVVSKSFFNIGLWIIPVAIFVTLFVLLISRMQGGKRE